MAENFYEMYREEMGAIRPFAEGEEARLLELVREGDAAARRRLVEGSLERAAELASAYEGRELPMSDLVQEANMALTLAAVEYDGSEEWKELMERRIRDAVALALQEQQTENRIEETMAARVNVLQTVSQVLAKELGREATLEELAAKMKMSEDEIRDIMKLALDALTINGEGQAAQPEEEPADGNPMRDGWNLEELR